MATTTTFTPHLPAEVQHQIEQAFYQKVTEASKVKNLKKDASFFQRMTKHIGLYTDHGVVHVRDVASRILQLIPKVNGVLIPKRTDERLAFMQTLGVQLAYLHDIGMSNLSDFGRFIHPEFAAKYVFTNHFRPMLNALWQETDIKKSIQAAFPDESEDAHLRLYQEVLALSFAHSKSKLPITVLNHPQQLSEQLLWILQHSVYEIYADQQMARLSNLFTPSEKANRKQRFLVAAQKHTIPYLEDAAPVKDTHATRPLDWMNSNDPVQQMLRTDILDTLRCLRAADALRQRGITLRTSAGYEIFIDRKNAHAIYALHDGDTGQSILLKSQKKLNAGEANLAGSEFDLQGNLRLHFHTGYFPNNKVIKRAAHNLAIVINDIQADVIQSFDRTGYHDTSTDHNGVTKAFEDIKISIEETPDNPTFTDKVIAATLELNPALMPILQKTFALSTYTSAEVERYLKASCIDAIMDKKSLMKRIKKKLTAIRILPKKMDTKAMFEDTALAEVAVNEYLIKSGDVAGFVYLPLEEGLIVRPLGGYRERIVKKWIPIGNTSVIRNARRNADVIATKQTTVLMIPKLVYLNHWYYPYRPKEMVELWR